MDGILRPLVQPLQHGDGGLQHGFGHLGVSFRFLVGEQIGAVLGQYVKEGHLFRDVGEPFAPGLQQCGNLRC